MVLLVWLSSYGCTWEFAKHSRSQSCTQLLPYATLMPLSCLATSYMHPWHKKTHANQAPKVMLIQLRFTLITGTTSIHFNNLFFRTYDSCTRAGMCIATHLAADEKFHILHTRILKSVYWVISSLLQHLWKLAQIHEYRSQHWCSAKVWCNVCTYWHGTP